MDNLFNNALQFLQDHPVGSVIGAIVSYYLLKKFFFTILILVVVVFLGVSYYGG